MVVPYLIIIIYKGSRGPNTKGPGIFTLEFNWYLRDFAIPASPTWLPATGVRSTRADTRDKHISQSTPTTSRISQWVCPEKRLS